MNPFAHLFKLCGGPLIDSGRCCACACACMDHHSKSLFIDIADGCSVCVRISAYGRAILHFRYAMHAICARNVNGLAANIRCWSVCIGRSTRKRVGLMIDECFCVGTDPSSLVHAQSQRTGRSPEALYRFRENRHHFQRAMGWVYYTTIITLKTHTHTRTRSRC